MIDHWPSGSRDTTEFPQININIEPSFRNHLEAFCKLDGVGWNDYEQQKVVSGLAVEPQRIRTYRKLYQNLGLIFKNDDEIKLSDLGNQLTLLAGNIVKSRDQNLSKIAKIAVDILSRYQISNPTESQRNELPDNCDVLPCICIWKSMLGLDNKLHQEEINRILLRVMSMEQLDEAIKKIASVRKDHFPYQNCSSTELENYLGVPVHVEQPSARIAPWFSFAGWGGLLIDRNVDSDGFRNLVPSQIPLLIQAVSNPPTFFYTDDEDKWYEYYIGSAANSLEVTSSTSSNGNLYNIVNDFKNDIDGSNLIFEQDLLKRFISSCLTKKFVILTGLSGSGKTKLAHAFSAWISESTQQYRIVAVGADWTSNENILGYQDALQTDTYRKPANGALELILRAEKDSDKPYFLIFDEMNLSHVERYLADILSAIESGHKIALHSTNGNLESYKGDPLPVPSHICLPENLFIIGTVNVDETTYMFSPKVLDRANVIEFRAKEPDIVAFLECPKKVDMEFLGSRGAQFGCDFVIAGRPNVTLQDLPPELLRPEDTVVIKSQLTNLFRELSFIGAEFGFRTVYEIFRFLYHHAMLTGTGWNFNDAMDAQIVQKLMPKLHGSDRKLRPVLEKLAKFCSDNNLKLSLEKTNRMLDRLKDGFTSFAEA